MNKKALIAITAIGLAGVAGAGVIWDATTANSTVVANNAAVVGTLTGTQGDLQVTALSKVNGGVDFSNVGFVSNSDINTMIGGAGLTSADTLTFTATITGITGLIRANGVEFGMNPTTTWRDDDNLLYAVRALNADHLFQANAFQDAGTFSAKSSEASMKDGFDITLVANSAGYTFTINDIVDSANGDATTIVKTGTFAGNEFLDHFAGGHFSLTVQRFKDATAGGTANTVMSISEAQVSVIPEPATLGLFAAFGGGIMFIRRRFMI